MRRFYAILSVLVLVVAAQAVRVQRFLLANATSSIQGSGAGRPPAPGTVPADVAFALPEAAGK